jgi:hypothetical protein
LATKMKRFSERFLNPARPSSRAILREIACVLSEILGEMAHNVQAGATFIALHGLDPISDETRHRLSNISAVTPQQPSSLSCPLLIDSVPSSNNQGRAKGQTSAESSTQRGHRPKDNSTGKYRGILVTPRRGQRNQTTAPSIYGTTAGDLAHDLRPKGPD